LHAAYGQTADEARDAQRRQLETERQEHLRQKSAEEEARASAAKPVEHKRDLKACEGARLAYQAYCGSPAAPRWRNPNCRDAEKQLLYAC